MCPDDKTTATTPPENQVTVTKRAAADEQTHQDPATSPTKRSVTRRQFVTGVGVVGAGLVVGGSLIYGLLMPDQIFAVPASGGYLLVDMKKCAGCSTCMMACSLTHFGKTGYSFSRLQVLQNSFEKFPDDITISQCLQCKDPKCLDACPTRAMYVDKNSGVRMVDARKCIGCERCIEACPYEPARMAWNSEDGVAMKCDLCTDTPYWEEKGGVDGKRACETYCPFDAIVFTENMPKQSVEGYNTDLRTPVNFGLYGFDRAAAPKTDSATH